MILTRTLIFLLLVQRLYCSINEDLIARFIPENTGMIFYEKTQIVTGFVDFGFKEVQLTDLCQGQSEQQKTLFRVTNGGHIKNVIIGKNAGNGIVCDGDCTLENVHWRDVCEVCFFLYIL